MQQNGPLIMFDGPDGVGKSTQLQLVADELRQAGKKVFTTHMLGGTDIGEALRAVVFSDLPRPPLTNFHINLAIYYALAAEVAKHRADGETVLIDRSPLSLFAYQVYGDRLDEALGLQACQDALQAFQPTKVLIYEAPLKTLQARRKEQQKGKAGDYFEKQELDYHERTTEGYRRAAEHYQLETIDADGSVEAIHRRTMARLEPLLTSS